MSKNKTIKIKYFTNDIDKISKIDKGDWIDLRATKTVELKAGDYALIPLGVGMILPDGYEAHIVPRSSTFKNYGVLQTNSMGVIDNSYCGENDQWHFPAYATRATTIGKNDRICQFRIQKKQPEIDFEEVEHLKEESRGGFGSTGTSTYEKEVGTINSKYEAVENIFSGFSALYYEIFWATSGFAVVENAYERTKKWRLTIEQSLSYLQSKMYSGENLISRKFLSQITSIRKCYTDIRRICNKFDELKLANADSDTINKFGQICGEIDDVLDDVIETDPESLPDNEFKAKYTKAVQELTEILGADNVLATQEHIDNMVTTYEFFIDARSSAQREGGAT